MPERDGVQVVNVTPDGGHGTGQAARWLRGAAAALGVLAAAAAAVSWDAQYTMVHAVKHKSVFAALEAAIPDVGAAVFAALGIALALHGRRALRPRALNAACVGISVMQNALGAGPGWRELAIWVMPSAVYAVASDTLIGVVRAWVLARARNQGETLADDGPTPLALVGTLALWLLRLVLAPPSTLAGFRDWIVTDCPVAPGLRPGHLAQLRAARQEAAGQIALATAQKDEAVERAERQAQQAHEEAGRARTAEAELRAELDRVRADAAREREELRAWAGQQADGLRDELQQVRGDAARLVGQIRDSAAARVAALEQTAAELRTECDHLTQAAREREELRAWSERQINGLRAELRQAREDAAGLVDQVRDAAESRVAAVEEARAELRAERDRLAADLRAGSHRPLPGNGTRPRTRGSRGGEPTKRSQMIELAAQRRDLASIPLKEVSKLASSVAEQVGYSPGTARRELVRHVRDLQGTGADGVSGDGEEGQMR